MAERVRLRKCSPEIRRIQILKGLMIVGFHVCVSVDCFLVAFLLVICFALYCMVLLIPSTSSALAHVLGYWAQIVYDLGFAMVISAVSTL